MARSGIGATVDAMIGLDALCLQVRCAWGDQVVGVEQFPPDTVEVRLASSFGWYWSLLGVGVGWVAPWLAPWLQTSPPLVSSVRERPRGEFVVPDRVTDGEGSMPVWIRYLGGCLIDIPHGWAPRFRRDGRELSADVVRSEGRLRVSGDRLVIELGPDLEVEFTAGGLTFWSTLVGAAPRVERDGLSADELPWLVALMVAAGFAAFIAAFVATSPRPVSSVSAETSSVSSPD